VSTVRAMRPSVINVVPCMSAIPPSTRGGTKSYAVAQRNRPPDIYETGERLISGYLDKMYFMFTKL
jgi:hypothetical protein